MRLLVANRGEIARRVAHTARLLGIPTIAVYSEADAHAPHVRACTHAQPLLGAASSAPQETYLNIPRLLGAIERSNATHVHPGYGFLSENPEFAETCAQCSLEFIGPLPEQMRRWGDKVSARALAKSLGLPTIEGTELVEDVDDAVKKAEALGFPVLLKASGGGGGRGMHVLESKEELRAIFETARSESRAAFGNDALYFEKFIERPRHIEFHPGLR